MDGIKNPECAFSASAGERRYSARLDAPPCPPGSMLVEVYYLATPAERNNRKKKNKHVFVNIDLRGGGRANNTLSV